MGHEYVGEVVGIGQEVKGFKIGDRVSGEGHITCGHCRNCRGGRTHLCRNTIGVGVNRPIRELVAKQPGMVGVRLGVKQTGCAGFGYVLDSVSEPDKDDLLFEHDGAKLFVPLQAMPFIDGTEVDFVREGLNQIFKFHNPKAQNECGCGESFGV